MARNNTAPKDEQMAVQQPDEVQNIPQEPQQPNEVQNILQESQQPSETQNATQPVKLVVISARGLALREKPGKQHTMLAVLPTGTVLTGREADDNSEDWIAVETKAGKAGYVDTRFVSVVD